MADAWLELDTALKEQLRVVLKPEHPATEVELRGLSERGHACALIIGGELERSERRLAELDADPAPSLVPVAAAFRRVSDLRAHLGELDELLATLEKRAREVRTKRLLGGGSPRPVG